MTLNRFTVVSQLRSSIFAVLMGMLSFHLLAQTSGLHIGAYHEDPVTNPEDPTPGLLYLNLPAGDQSFKGLMDFTFVGCQSKSVGEIKGQKSSGSLKGEWAGQVDNTYQTGSYSGRYIAKDKYYTGTYVVGKGKQFVQVANCVKYYIAPHGTWSIFELNHTFSESSPYESVNISGGVAKWALPPSATIASVSLVDKDLAISGAKNAVLQQMIIPASLKQFRIPAQYLNSGKSYVASVIASDGRKVVYFSSTEFPQKTSETPTIYGSLPTNSVNQPDGANVNTNSRTPTIIISRPAADTNNTANPLGKLPPTFGSEKPSAKSPVEEDAVCAGTYEGHYDGDREGVMHMVVSPNGRSTGGYAATGGYDENIRLQDWIKKPESDGVRPFQLSQITSDEVCSFKFAGAWMAPMSSITPFKIQYLSFTGEADGDYMYGEYRFDNNPSSPIMGRYRLKRVR